MEFFGSAVTVLQTLVVALGAGLGIWGAINLLEGWKRQSGCEITGYETAYGWRWCSTYRYNISTFTCRIVLIFRNGGIAFGWHTRTDNEIGSKKRSVAELWIICRGCLIQSTNRLAILRYRERPRELFTRLFHD